MIVNEVLKPDASGAQAALRELCLYLKELRADKREDARFVYSAHCYAIVRVSLAMRERRHQPPEIHPDRTRASRPRRDPRITLRNPHRINTPHSAPVSDPRKFELTLAQFVRNFTTLHSRESRAPTHSRSSDNR